MMIEKMVSFFKELYPLLEEECIGDDECDIMIMGDYEKCNKFGTIICPKEFKKYAKDEFGVFLK